MAGGQPEAQYVNAKKVGGASDAGFIEGR